MTAKPIELREYQHNLVTEVRAAYRDGHKCPLVVASTGLGKTVLFSYITHSAAARGNPVLIAAHRKEIIRQISLSLARFGVDHRIIAPPKVIRQIKVAHFKAFGRSYVRDGALVMVGSVQTIVTRFDSIDSAIAAAGDGKKFMIIMDEGHHVVEDTQWGRVMERYGLGAIPALETVIRIATLGLIVTASPERLDGRGLGKGHGGFADFMIEAPSMSWAIANGYLSPYRIFTAPEQIDLSDVHTRMGDYVASEVAEKIDKPHVTGDAITHWNKHAKGMRTVVFCVSVEHSKHVAAEFAAAGIQSAHIDGGIEDDERDKAIIDFSEGRVQVLCNVNLVSEGFDLASIAQKDVTIDCVIDLAPTQSLVNFMQRTGRALRPFPGKVAILLDHAGNVFRHGLPDEDREWSLEGRKKGKRGANTEEKEETMRKCPKCFAAHAFAPACPCCEYVYPAQDRKVEQREGELQEVTPEQIEYARKQRLMTQGKMQTIEEMIAAGYPAKQAEKIIQAREEKSALREQIIEGLMAHAKQHGGFVGQAFGVTLRDVKMVMKPKALKELLVRVQSA